MTDYLSRRTVTFIVRLWTEYLEQTPPVWRGEIERADTKEVRRFQTLEDITEYLRRNAEAQPEPIKKEAV